MSSSMYTSFLGKMHTHIERFSSGNIMLHLTRNKFQEGQVTVQLVFSDTNLRALIDAIQQFFAKEAADELMESTEYQWEVGESIA